MQHRWPGHKVLPEILGLAARSKRGDTHANLQDSCTVIKPVLLLTRWVARDLDLRPSVAGDGGAPPRASVRPGTDADAVRKLLPRKGVGETCYKLAFACKGNIF